MRASFGITQEPTQSHDPHHDQQSGDGEDGERKLRERNEWSTLLVGEHARHVDRRPTIQRGPQQVREPQPQRDRPPRPMAQRRGARVSRKPTSVPAINTTTVCLFSSATPATTPVMIHGANRGVRKARTISTIVADTNT
jgi:hypothetical protein